MWGLYYSLDSSSKCNIVWFSKEYLIGCFIPKSFPWTIVESFHGVDQLLIRNGPKVPIFRKVLTDKTVGVFICPSFPGRVRMGKIKTAFQSLCDFLMISKLFSIIGCDCMNFVGNGVQQPFDCHFRILFCSSIHLVYKESVRIFFLSERQWPAYGPYQ